MRSRSAAIGAALAVLVPSCAGKVPAPAQVDRSNAPDARSSGGTSASGGAGGVNLGPRADVGAGACPQCPAQADLVQCCESYCGYRNDQLEECVPSVVGGRALTVVESPNGGLCVAKLRCDQAATCPADTPAEKSACSQPMTCHFCLGGALPRTMVCSQSHWATIGPNVNCAFYTEP